MTRFTRSGRSHPAGSVARCLCLTLALMAAACSGAATPTARPPGSGSASPGASSSATAANPTSTAIPGASSDIGHFLALGDPLYDNDQAVALDGDRVYLAGGSECSPTGTCGSIDETQIFDRTSRTFAASVPLNMAGYSVHMTVLSGGKVLLLDEEGTAMTFDPSNGALTSAGTWTGAAGPNPDEYLRYFALAPLANGKGLIAGGGWPLVDTDQAQLYDPSPKTFSPTGHLSSARSLPQAVRLADGRVLVAGGQTGWGASLAAVASADVYDPSGTTATATGSMASPRILFGLVLLADDTVLVVGGSGPSALNTAELYDPSTGQFTTVGSMGTARERAAVVRLTSGRVLVAGGINGQMPDGTPRTLASTEIYDPVTRSFTAGPNLPWSAATITATLLGDGTVLLTGDKKAVLYVP
jgi:hypothetical protein